MLVATAVLALPSAHAATGDITEFALPTPGAGPLNTIEGPDGNFWLTEERVDKIARVTPSGAVREFSTTRGSAPTWIAPGPDGNLWFTESNGIGRMSTGGRLLGEFRLPTPNSDAAGITLGPDGNMWFAEFSGNKIGRITPGGRISEYPVGVNEGPNDLVTGSDGNIWVGETPGNAIARVTPSGHITQFRVPTPGSYPGIVAAGPDGNVWFSEAMGAKIGRITPSGAISEFPLPNPGSSPSSLVSGPDAAIWFSDGNSNGGSIARIATDGTISEFPLPGNDYPGGIAVGSDQNIWFVDDSSNAVGRLLIDPATTARPPPVFAQSVDATVVGGAVNVKAPGSSHFAPLTRPEQLQVGATIDARAGRVRITIVDASGKTSTADFYGGVFKITQLAVEGGVAQLALVGGRFASCTRVARAATAARKKQRSAKSIRNLWASGSGSFRTLGKYASAAIRGTTWDTVDRCDGTLVKVTQGAVTVRDLVRRKTVVVRAHRQYLAKAR